MPASPEKWRGRVLAVLLVTACVLGATLLFTGRDPVMTLRLSYQKTGEIILERQIQPGDTLTVELTHSFEHVPWNEYYVVQEDGSFLLQRIEVGGFGAGIPAEMDVPTYVGEDGLVQMDDINSVFFRFNWITSQINMKDLLLNGEPVLAFSSLPHHSFVTCETVVQRRLFHFG